MLDLTGKVAVVTGSTRGIGRAIASALAEHGASVVIAARDAEAVEHVALELTQAAGANGGVVSGVACDVQRYEACHELMSEAVRRYGRLDVLVNNAGVGIYGPPDRLSPEDWRRVIGTNLDGVFYCCHAALPYLKRQGGWIINIGSLAGKHVFAGGSAYNASKFGLVGFTEALMEDVRHDGVRVSLIMPGSVATRFAGSEPSDQDAWKIQPADVAEVVIDLLSFPERTLPSRIEMRPSRPPKK